MTKDFRYFSYLKLWIPVKAVSHDPLEIILFLSMLKTVMLLNIFVETIMHFKGFFDV